MVHKKKTIHYFNRNKSKPTKKSSKKSSKIGPVVADGMPFNAIRKPKNGQFFVNQTTGDTYLYASQLGWLDMNGWQPFVGEGVPQQDNPPYPNSGDQYLNVLSGDLYVFAEGFGWVLQNGLQGPQGPPGDSFSFEIETVAGSRDGPTISGPISVKANQRVKLWIDNGQLHADVF